MRESAQHLKDRTKKFALRVIHLSEPAETSRRHDDVKSAVFD